MDGLRHLLGSLIGTARSLLGILGEVVLVAGIVGYSIAPKKVTPWVVVAGLALFALAAVGEQVKVRLRSADLEKQLQHEKAASWHWQQQWSIALTQQAGGSAAPTSPTGSPGQREFTFPDPAQIEFRLPPPQEGPYRSSEPDQP